MVIEYEDLNQGCEPGFGAVKNFNNGLRGIFSSGTRRKAKNFCNFFLFLDQKINNSSQPVLSEMPSKYRVELQS